MIGIIIRLFSNPIKLSLWISYLLENISQSGNDCLLLSNWNWDLSVEFFSLDFILHWWSIFQTSSAFKGAAPNENRWQRIVQQWLFRRDLHAEIWRGFLLYRLIKKKAVFGMRNWFYLLCLRIEKHNPSQIQIPRVISKNKERNFFVLKLVTLIN